MPRVSFFFDNVSVSLNNRTGLKKYIETLFKKERKRLSSINYIFCSDKRLLDINRQFLNHDYYTDIITFDLSEDHVTVAEIYISVERVKENAKARGISFKAEIHRVIFHGALHLCGYEDKNEIDKGKMKKMEDLYLTKYLD